jgi:hypothetical protein
MSVLLVAFKSVCLYILEKNNIKMRNIKVLVKEIVLIAK